MRGFVMYMKEMYLAKQEKALTATTVEDKSFIDMDVESKKIA